MPNAPTIEDTIFACASLPPSVIGGAGVAVIRISGTQAHNILGALLCGQALPPPRQLCLRSLYHPHNGDLLDKSMVVRFLAPHSFTGEDMVELHCHGGAAVLASIMAALGALGEEAHKNIRPAEAGEFTRRAVLAGKLDLTQAEAIADLVAAEGTAQQAQALAQMGGSLRRLFEGWRDRLVQVLAHLEAAIEFGTEDIDEAAVIAETLPLLPPLRAALADYYEDRRGMRLREGLRIVLSGPTNVGKSSILNALSGKEAAIVTPMRGTTRDVIEVAMILAGVPVVLVDTAGIRQTQDTIEGEGVRRALLQAEEADILLQVFSPDIKTDDLQENEPKIHENASKIDKMTQNIDKQTDKNNTKMTIENSQQENSLKLGNLTQNTSKNTQICIKIHNKCDLETKTDDDFDLKLSAKTGVGIDELLNLLENTIKTQFFTSNNAVLTRERHIQALGEAITALDRSIAAATDKIGIELVVEDIRLANRALGRVTGAVDVESLLDIVFADFCIGK